MMDRLRALAVVAVLLVVGIMIGSAITQRGRGVGSEVAANAADGTGAHVWDDGRVRVQVLNAGGTSGVAATATGVLRDLGLDVVDWRNDRQFTDSASRVVDRVGDTVLARQIADALGIEMVLSEPDSTRLVELTVKLGPAWAPPSVEPAPSDSLTPWWDLLRYFR